MPVSRKNTPRYLTSSIEADLTEKMVFLGGPRQVGKTTLARSLPGGVEGYLNWDIAEDRHALLSRTLPVAKLWVFDELHKFRGWRGYLKGLFDKTHGDPPILVTGSARLDWYRYGGDSLQGRYHYLRLHPFSFRELGSEKGTVEALFHKGGFPEPFLKLDARGARRWSLEYRSRLLRDDVQGVENLTDLGRLELLMATLPERVGSPLSINAIREDLQVSHQTIARWLDVFERVYAIFRLPPFGAPRLRAVKKEQKHYHFDWTLVQEPAARFENLVASHLLKWVHHQVDVEGRDLELRYFRDVDGREVDFIVVESRKPILAVECKSTAGQLDRGLRYFVERFPNIEAWQVSRVGVTHSRTPEGVQLAPVEKLLARLV
ncbi:MAG: ATP-binding protein [Archangium sp.]|nr:ATP-binding protein [Archangium sp.]